MKALSVRQPWTSLIASGRKTIEVRSWRTHYRGPLVICASAAPCRVARPNVERPKDAPLGVALCIVELVDCREIQPDDALAACEDAPTGFAWILRNVRTIERVAVKGRLGFFDVAA